MRNLGIGWNHPGVNPWNRDGQQRAGWLWFSGTGEQTREFAIDGQGVDGKVRKETASARRSLPSNQ